MLANYLRATCRNLARHKGYSLINIVGLAIGIAASLAVMLWVVDEIGYDTFHQNGDSIYRVYRKMNREGDIWYSEVTSAPIAPAIFERVPGITDYARTFGFFFPLRYQDKNVNEYGLCVDSSFLTMFSFPMVTGDPHTVLEHPNSIVLTRETANGLFGDENPLGKVLDNGLMVTGIIDKPPDNSSIEFAYLINLDYVSRTGVINIDEWYNFGFDTYLMVDGKTDFETITAGIKDLFKTVDEDAHIELHLQPLADMHLHNIGGGGRIIYVYVFTAVAMLLLAVACINFMNLATARAAKRTVEIGIRKSLGASRSQLAVQILAESIIQTFVAMVVAICILEISLPYLQDVFGKHLHLDFSLGLVAVLLGITVVTAFAAGSYPSFVLSGFRPVSVLKRSISSDGPRGTNFIRKGLVVFQFTISTGLIFAALVIYAQLNHIQNKDLGIEKDNIVCIRSHELGKDMDAFKSEMKRYPGVVAVSAAMEPPAWCGWRVAGFEYEGKPEDEDVRAGCAWVDYDYVDLFGLKIIDGRNFSREYPSDETQAYLVNEAAARLMKMADPVGMGLTLEEQPGTIVGLVKDYHFSSLHDNIEPLLIGIEPKYFEFLFVKVKPDAITGSMAHIEETWNHLRPGEPFEYRFFDDILGRQYAADAQVGTIVLGFTVITVLVACLGLFGLAAYSAERRTKEIGVRKVLGSSIPGIIRLLVKDFILLVVLGTIIAAPTAWYFIRGWLDDFAYRISVGWELFAITVGLAVVIAMATVSYQAIRAARTNPVDALKYD